MGGMSKCPGETLTAARQSGVTLMAINNYCGIGRNESCLNLALGETAYFGAVIENLSPTCTSIVYRLVLLLIASYVQIYIAICAFSLLIAFFLLQLRQLIIRW